MVVCVFIILTKLSSFAASEVVMYTISCADGDENFDKIIFSFQCSTSEFWFSLQYFRFRFPGDGTVKEDEFVTKWAQVGTLFRPYSHVTGTLWRLKSSVTHMLVQERVQSNYRENIEIPHYWGGGY